MGFVSTCVCACMRVYVHMCCQCVYAAVGVVCQSLYVLLDGREKDLLPSQEKFAIFYSYVPNDC